MTQNKHPQLGDSCSGKELGFHHGKRMMYVECPTCNKRRWAQKSYKDGDHATHKLCAPCARAESSREFGSYFRR